MIQIDFFNDLRRFCYDAQIMLVFATAAACTANCGTACFCAELDAAFTDQIVLLADSRNGKPLLPDTGPWQIVVPNDKRPARWIRQVNKIEVRQLQ